MVCLKDADTSETHHFEVLFDKAGDKQGRVDWIAAMAEFKASHLALVVDGIELNLSLYRSGDREGLTRRLFDPDEELDVRAEKERQKNDWVDTLLHPEHSSRLHVHEAIDRLVVKEAADDSLVNVGTIVRISQEGHMVTTRHSCVDEGVLLELQAFGSRLEFLAASPDDDIIFLKGPSGPHLTLVEAGHLALGRPVTLLAFPQAVDVELALPAKVSPTSTTGAIVAFGTVGTLVAADYGGAMPNSSGGAVVLDTKYLCGIHTGDFFHTDVSDLLPEETKDAQKPPKVLETDPAALWKGEACAKPLDGNPNAAARLRALKHSVTNIDFKASLGIFVPSNRILELLIDLGLRAKDSLKVATQNSASRKRYRS